jgi:isoprenylcysteine carboxyl methyltransferase (ICMT) family protein YpbQ
VHYIAQIYNIWAIYCTLTGFTLLLFHIFHPDLSEEVCLLKSHILSNFILHNLGKIWVVEMLLCPRSLLTISIETPFRSVTDVAKV